MIVAFSSVASGNAFHGSEFRGGLIWASWGIAVSGGDLIGASEAVTFERAASGGVAAGENAARAIPSWSITAGLAICGCNLVGTFRGITFGRVVF